MTDDLVGEISARIYLSPKKKKTVTLFGLIHLAYQAIKLSSQAGVTADDAPPFCKLSIHQGQNSQRRFLRR